MAFTVVLTDLKQLSQRQSEGVQHKLDLRPELIGLELVAIPAARQH